MIATIPLFKSTLFCVCSALLLGQTVAQKRSDTLMLPASAATATKTEAGVPLSDLSPNAPASYVVKKGDTLWDISGLFLKSPWKWPQIWGMNKAVVRDPHWIYPGQALVLTRHGDRATLGFANGLEGLPPAKLSPNGDVKLSPAARIEPLDALPISSVQLSNVAQFLSQPLIVDDAALKNSGYILSGSEARVYAGKGDTIYVRGLPAGEESRFQIYRPSKALRDPDTGLVVAYEAFYLGTAEMVQNGDPAKLKILSSKEEMAQGDRLLPEVKLGSLNYVPRAPEVEVSAKIMSSYGGLVHSGSNMVVTLNKGRKDGLENGHVLALWKTGPWVIDREKVDTSSRWSEFMGTPQRIKLPDEKNGHVIVFRVFDNVAYALVLGTTMPTQVGDTVSQPK